METTKILQYIIVGVVTLILSSLLTKKLNKAKPKDIGDKKIMEMPKIYFVLSNLLFLSFVFIESSILYYNAPDFLIGEKLIYGAFGLFLGFGGINTLLLFIKHNIVYDNESIKQTNWLGKTMIIDWDEIEKISFSPIASSLKIESHDKKILIHEHIKGYKSFLGLIENKTNLKLK